MKVITHLRRNPFPPHKTKICLALGNFDGVHLGHRTLLREICSKAARIRGIPAVFTFIHHPRIILKPDHPVHILTPWQERLALLEKTGIRAGYLLRFTKQFSKMTPEEFVREILVKKIGVHSVYMGFNARFGHNRQGSAKTMERLSKRYGFHFQAVKPRKASGKIVNSTRIRSLIERGRLEEAAQILGQPAFLIGTVIHGSGRGKKLGFPTANLRQENGVLPPTGVYVVSAKIIRSRKKKRPYGFDLKDTSSKQGILGLLNLGYRPTFKRADKVRHPLPEVFLLNSGRHTLNLYGKRLQLSMLKYLRREKKFSNSDLLVKQIKKDVLAARHYYRGARLKRKYMRKQGFTT